MKKTLLLLSLIIMAMTASAQKKPMSEFIDDLMSKMTLDEKIGQINLLPGGDIVTGKVMNSPVATMVEKSELGNILSIRGIDKIKALQEIAVKKTRLGIPLIIGYDVIHGFNTVLPIPLAQACSWDPEAVEQGARMSVREATADGINWVYSPMVDVAHDPRWGRVAEGYGEDPYMSGTMAKAAVRGYQGGVNINTEPTAIINPQNVLACLKHYALYGASEAGKDYTTVDMSRLRMYNQYLPPYKAAVEAGVGSVMSSFNIIDGVPAAGNGWLLNHVLRSYWGFKGFTVTDYGSIGEMKQLGFGDNKVSAAQALKAGTDMDMCSEAFSKHLKECLSDGSVTMADIDQAVRRVLEAKYRLGLFADPYRYCDTKRAKAAFYTDENRKTARDMAVETFVLLKNQDNLLPLKKQGTIALIGPLADTRTQILGTWTTAADTAKYTTIKEAVQRCLGDKARVVYAQGSNIYYDAERQHSVEMGWPVPRGDDRQLLNEALQAARQSDVIVACLGELADMSGESSSRSDLCLPDAQSDLLRALVATGKPVVLLNFAGRPTILSWEDEHVQAIMNVWHPGSEAGPAICDVLFGDKAPSGKLVNTFPRNMGQIPIYYNHTSESRPAPDGQKYFHKYVSNYIDVANGPLYPFGYGLSYTSYSYGDVSLSAPSMGKDGKVTASVTVTNTGNRDGDEVVQLYIHDKYCSIVRPVKELKGFRRIHLLKGESKTVSFGIDASTLQYLDADGKPFLEPGDFEIMIGANSRDVKTAQLTLVGAGLVPVRSPQRGDSTN